jgi:hypothetical protein
MKTRNELALVARTHAREALRVLVEIMNSKDASPTARAAAAKVLRRHLKVIGGSMSDDWNNLVTNSLKRSAVGRTRPETIDPR